MRWLLVVALVAGCGGRARTTKTTTPQTAVAERMTDWMVAMLPAGAQIIVEVDLARLRTNEVVGAVAKQMLDELGAEQKLPGLPMMVQGSPLGSADAMVFGSYGVGTPEAATVILLATNEEIVGSMRIAANLVVIAVPEWREQVAARATIAKLTPEVAVTLGGRLPITLAEDLTRLREHAMPGKAPGALLRVTAQLSFDARITLARQVGLEVAPAQLSLWADVVDDFALVLDADAADPGQKDSKAARAQVARSLKRFLNTIAADPAVRAVGFSSAIAGARFIEQGTWVRAIIEVGPRQLARAVERARAMLPPGGAENLGPPTPRPPAS